jgi:HK97 family phage major capsid protein
MEEPMNDAAVKQMLEHARTITEGVESLLPRVEKLEEAHEGTAKALHTIEQNAEKRATGTGIPLGEFATPKRWQNPNVSTGQQRRIAEWWRGYLLTGSDSDVIRRAGREHMERAVPGAFDEYAKWRAEQNQQAGMSRIEKAFVSSTDIVPAVLSPFIDHARAEPSFLGDIGQVVEMGSGSHKVPKEATAVTAANYDEDATIAEGQFTVGSTTLTATKGARIGQFSIESVQDASADVLMHQIRRVLDAVNELETAQGLEGDGTGSNFTGVLSGSGVNEVDLANGGAALADLDLLAEMVTAIPASERDPQRCAWFVSSDGLRALLQIQNATEKDPMLGQTPTELFGFRIIVSDQIATTTGTPDTSTIYFGNWRGLLVGRRGPDMIDIVPAGATDAAFTKAHVSVRVIRRYAVAVHLATLLVRGINFYVAA